MQGWAVHAKCGTIERSSGQELTATNGFQIYTSVTTSNRSLFTCVVYFNQHWSAAPMNAGQNLSKMPLKAGIYLKFIEI